MRQSILRGRWALVVTAFALSFAGWLAVSSARSASTATPAAAHHDHDRAPYTTHPIGPRVNPRPVQAKIDGLNRAYDACMAAHGSKRVPYASGGWKYEKNDSATAACQPQLDAISSYVDSPEYRAHDADIRARLKQFWDCVDALAAPDDSSVQACADQASYHD